MRIWAQNEIFGFFILYSLAISVYSEGSDRGVAKYFFGIPMVNSCGSFLRLLYFGVFGKSGIKDRLKTYLLTQEGGY